MNTSKVHFLFFQQPVPQHTPQPMEVTQGERPETAAEQSEVTTSTSIDVAHVSSRISIPKCVYKEIAFNAHH